MNQSAFEFEKRATEVKGKYFNCYLRDLRLAQVHKQLLAVTSQNMSEKLRLLNSCFLKGKLLARSYYAH